MEVDSDGPADNLGVSDGAQEQVQGNPEGNPQNSVPEVPDTEAKQESGNNSQTLAPSERWKGGFKPEYRSHELLKDMGNMNRLFEAYRDSQEKLKSIEGRVIPGEDGTEEDWATYRKAMGVPDSIDGYQFEYPENMDKNLLDGMSDWVKNVAFEEGLPVGVTKNIFNRWAKDLQNSQQAQHDAAVKEKQAGLLDLSKEYGKNWDATLSASKDLAKRMFGEDGFNVLKEANLLDNPVILKSLIGLKGRVSEDTLPSGAGVTGVSGGEPSARSKAASLFPETKSYG